MDKTIVDQKRSSFDANVLNPSRPIRFLMNRSRLGRQRGTVAAEKEMETIDERTSYAPATHYGYLEHIRSLKPLLTPQDKSLPKKVR